MSVAKNISADEKSLTPQAELFTLRIWVTSPKNAPLEWRGRIQHVRSSEVKFCQDWDTLFRFVEEVLSNQSRLKT